MNNEKAILIFEFDHPNISYYDHGDVEHVVNTMREQYPDAKETIGTSSDIVLDELFRKHLSFEDEEKIRRDERYKIYCKLNSLVPLGNVEGNGSDKQAQRNGLIIALNTIYEMGVE